MDLSIVIVNFNTKDLTLGAIDSILKSKPKVSYDIIVVDNGSFDGSVEEFRKIKSVKLITNRQNLGFSKAVNQAIKISKGRNILLLNSDTKIKGRTLDSLLDFVTGSEDAGVVGPKLLNVDGSTQASVYRFPTLVGAFKEFWLGQKSAFEKYYPQGDSPVLVDAVVGAAFLISEKARKRVGLLNENFFLYFEDLDYCKRVKEKGLAVYYLPGAEVFHHHGASAKDFPEKQNITLVKSSKIYHGLPKYYLITFIIWSANKFKKILFLKVL